jgi:Tfp pilus assembly protein PilF
LEDAGSRWQSAVAYYIKAIVADPLEREAYVDLGYDYEQHHLYALAEASFLKGLSVSPGDGRLHYLLAETYAAQGKRDLAREEYRHATSSDEPEIAHAAVRDLASFQ